MFPVVTHQSTALEMEKRLVASATRLRLFILWLLMVLVLLNMALSVLGIATLGNVKENGTELTDVVTRQNGVIDEMSSEVVRLREVVIGLGGDPGPLPAIRVVVEPTPTTTTSRPTTTSTATTTTVHEEPTTTTTTTTRPCRVTLPGQCFSG